MKVVKLDLHAGKVVSLDVPKRFASQWWVVPASYRACSANRHLYPQQSGQTASAQVQRQQTVVVFSCCHEDTISMMLCCMTVKTVKLQGCTRQTALERHDLCCMYLDHHGVFQFSYIATTRRHSNAAPPPWPKQEICAQQQIQETRKVVLQHSHLLAELWPDPWDAA